MATGDHLLDFVKDALGRGVPRPQIEEALRKAGWTADQIRGALTAFAEVDFPIPVPRARPYLSAREAFMYLVLFGTLYSSAYSLGSLAFDFINIAFPDPAAGSSFRETEEYVRQSIRWSVSMLIVAFPVFMYTSLLTGRAISLDPTKRASKVRRWLTYWTLFIAACALIGDVTTLVYNLLGGELTVRFMLKVIVVALIAGTAFTYYLRDLRQDEEETGLKGAGGRGQGAGVRG
ncbi:MAG TPA: DUF5671 domain-containing protein [Vicinamibacterales bacterium]|nr:DUF5671 domain-containing protein [Vicinamibacterales bacterium]